MDENKSACSNNELTKEGYLEKQSLYLKKFRKRFIILRQNHLFCYDNHKKTQITEFIKLSVFHRAQLSNKELNQFVLIPKDEKEKTRVFAAQSMNEAHDWVEYLNCSMNPDDTQESNNNDHNHDDKKQGAPV